MVRIASSVKRSRASDPRPSWRSAASNSEPPKWTWPTCWGGGEEGEGGEDAIPLIRARGDCEQTSLHLAPVLVSNSSHTLSLLCSLFRLSPDWLWGPLSIINLIQMIPTGALYFTFNQRNICLAMSATALKICLCLATSKKAVLDCFYKHFNKPRKTFLN